MLYQATNDDATSCKLSAVNLGYWRDPFVQVFIISHMVASVCNYPLYDLSIELLFFTQRLQERYLLHYIVLFSTSILSWWWSGGSVERQRLILVTMPGLPESGWLRFNICLLRNTEVVLGGTRARWVGDVCVMFSSPSQQVMIRLGEGAQKNKKKTNKG